MPTSDFLVGALLRGVEVAGGFGFILLRGDPIRGVIVVQILERGRFCGLFERMTGLDGRSSLVRCGPKENAQALEITEYIEKRRRSDPDLWVVELDVADGQRFAAQTLCRD